MTTITDSKFRSTVTALVCTVLLSTTVVLSAVGPAQAASVTATAPASAPMA